ncbi:MAG: sterol desaturase family protein [Sulfurifustaceae bacterium]
MDPIEFIGLLTPATFLVMLGIESLRPARPFPAIRGWRWIGLGLLLMVGASSTVVPLLLPLDWLAAHRLLDGTGLGVAGGAIVGFLVYSFLNFAYHRATHAFSWLWRLTHQLHHSPQRVDLAGAVLFHPLDISMYILLGTLTSTFVLGLDPLAAAIVGYLSAFFSFFQHWNIRTSRWLGYFIQRPESHCIHHQRGVHGYNYADVPLWDMLFGSFRNPQSWSGEAGFEQPAAGKFGAMLLFVDANRSRYGVRNRGVPRLNGLGGEVA